MEGDLALASSIRIRGRAEEEEEKPKTRTRHEGDPERVATWLGVWVGLLGVDEIEADFPLPLFSLPSICLCPVGQPTAAQSCLLHPAFIIFIYFCSWAIGLFLVLLGKKN